MTDLDDWARLDADPDLTRFIGGARTRAESKTGLNQARRMWARRGANLFSIRLKTSCVWLGRAGPWIPPDGIGPEIGWAFLAEAQGSGYATEAGRVAMDWAFSALGWTEVVHGIHRENVASIAVAERLGSRRLRSQLSNDGQIVDIYGQSRADWLQQHEATAEPSREPPSERQPARSAHV